MKISAKPKMSLHNEFDIHVRDIVSGKVEKYKAYNIVLDSMLSHMASYSTSTVFRVNRIHVGSGTGTLDSTRQNLFNNVLIREYSHVDRGFDSETLEGWEQKKIVIVPAELVGTTFTELGLGTQHIDYLRTHAFIEDSEGNPISIGPKTDTEEITFYATWYYKLLGDGVNGINYIGFDNASQQNNGLRRYMMTLTNTFSNAFTTQGSIFVGTSRKPTLQMNDSILGTWLAYRSPARLSIGSSQDGFSRKYNSTARFEGHQANGDLTEINFMAVNSNDYRNPIFRALVKDLPSSVWDGVTFTGKEIGTGDGTETGFNSEHSFLEDETVYVAGVSVVGYTKRRYPKDRVVTSHDIAGWNLVEAESGVSNMQRIFDGSTGSFANVSNGSEFIIDLIDNIDWGIEAIDIHNEATSNFYWATNFDVYVSGDKETWTKVLEGATTNASSSWKTNNFTSTAGTFRYVKVHLITSSAGSGWRINEIRFPITENQIAFDVAPDSGNAVTMDYTIREYIPKSESFFLDMSGPTITFGDESAE